MPRHPEQSEGSPSRLRRFAALSVTFVLVLIASCTRLPVQDEVTIEFSNDSDLVTVTAETRFELQPANAGIRKRVDTARELAQSGTDAWSMRFGRLSPE